jgi:hypothetical protein
MKEDKNSDKSNSSKSKTNKSNKSKSKSNKSNKTKEKFGSGTTFTDVIDALSVSPTAGDKAVTFNDQLQDYFILFLKYGFLVGVLTLNFLGLSVSLNCNADQELSQRIMSAIFAFFFGFVYLVVNYYTYKVLGQGKICKMDRDKLFPFKV